MRVPRWCQWSEWRYQVRFRLWGMVQRSRRGWADHDVWSFDTYLADVLAGGLRRLAEQSHGYPCEFEQRYGDERGPIEWETWLREKADWFEWYAKDEDGTSDEKGWIAPGLSDEEKRRRIDAHVAKMKEFHEVVMPDFGRHFGSLWD